MEVGTTLLENGTANNLSSFKAEYDPLENIAVLTSNHSLQQPASRFGSMLPYLMQRWQKCPDYNFQWAWEIPWLRQATFSIWENTDKMKNFAYQNLQHQDVIQKPETKPGYKEELFARMHCSSLFTLE
jgi:hypothetical protein